MTESEADRGQKTVIDRPKCERCGVCCGSGPCEYGEEDDYGICIHLRLNQEGLAECRLLCEGKIKPEDISIGKGCVMRMSPEIYGFCRPLFDERMALRLASGTVKT